MRPVILLASLLTVTLTGCTSTSAAKKADQAITAPRTRTLPTFSQRMRYQQTHKETPKVGKTTVEGELVR